MKWSECSIHTTEEAVEPISNILHEAGASGVVIEDSYDLEREWNKAEDEIFDLSSEDYPEEGVIIKAYFPVNLVLKETIQEIKEAINGLTLHNIDIGHNRMKITEIHEEEWANAWKKYYKPVKVSDSITISPSWEDYEPVKSDQHIIELDPGMAFGTGTHPTTVLCLKSLEGHLKQGEKVIDVGTGTGVLSIAAAKLGAESVLALDVDEVAVESARMNASINQVSESIEVKQHSLLEGISEKANVIVANILAEIIIRMLEDAKNLLLPNGRLIVSGIIGGKKQEVKDALQETGFHIEDILEMEDWVAIVAKNKDDVQVN